MWGRACARTSMITPLVRSSSCFATRTAGFCWMPVRIARSRVNLRPPAVRVAVETRVRFGVAVGVGLGTRVGVGVAVGATEDSSITAATFVAEASPLPANVSPPASIPLLRMRIKRCFRMKKIEPSNWMREVQRVDSIPALFYRCVITRPPNR